MSILERYWQLSVALIGAIFAAGGAVAWAEGELDKIRTVQKSQAVIVENQSRYSAAIIRLEESAKFQKQQQADIQKKLDLLIELQIRGGGHDGPN